MSYISHNLGDRHGCGTCAKPILRVLTKLNNSSVVDADPSPDGTMTLTPTPQGLRALVVPKPDRAGRDDLYISHFATCPDANEWRNKR